MDRLCDADLYGAYNFCLRSDHGCLEYAAHQQVANCTWTKNPIDPDKNGFIGRLFSFLLVLFLLTMPITALNGIATVFYVMVNNPPNAEEVLNYGGIIGYSIFVRIDLISEILFHWEFIKPTSIPLVVSHTQHRHRRVGVHF